MAGALRFVIVPKVAHPWFEEVYRGALAQAALLGCELGDEVKVEYRPPAIAGAAEQNDLLNVIAEERPSGIAIDPVEPLSRMTAIHRIREVGIPLVVFDSPSTEPGITSIGNDFAKQGSIAAERLARLIRHTGKVAVMRGYPTAPNHKLRYDAQMALLCQHPDITVVDGGVDNDDIETAHREASSVLRSHPDLKGYLCCDASGPVGIAAAVREADRVGQVTVVGMDGIRPILEAIKAGVIESSAATIPRLQGSISVLMLWQATLGVQLPHAVDTGIDIITHANVDRFLATAA